MKLTRRCDYINYGHIASYKMIKIRKEITIMTKEVKLAQLKDRRNVLAQRDKDNAGVIRKLDRQIRNLEKTI